MGILHDYGNLQMLPSKKLAPQIPWRSACLYSPSPGIQGGRHGHGLSEEVFDHRAHQTSKEPNNPWIQQWHGNWVGKHLPTQKQQKNKHSSPNWNLVKKTLKNYPNTPKPGNPASCILETFPQGPWSIAHAEQIAVLMPRGGRGAMSEAPARHPQSPSWRFLDQQMEGGGDGWPTDLNICGSWILTYLTQTKNPSFQKEQIEEFVNSLVTQFDNCLDDPSGKATSLMMTGWTGHWSMENHDQSQW